MSDRKIPVILQARMSSKRLPGKVLRVKGKPMLEWQILRLQRCRLIEQTVVATSNDPSDDAIFEFCKTKKIDCHRGSLENVASRFADMIRQRSLDAFIRVSGDSPLLDPKLLDSCVKVFNSAMKIFKFSFQKLLKLFLIFSMKP